MVDRADCPQLCHSYVWLLDRGICFPLMAICPLMSYCGKIELPIKQKKIQEQDPATNLYSFWKIGSDAEVQILKPNHIAAIEFLKKKVKLSFNHVFLLNGS